MGFSHEYDEWRDYDNERNYFSFVCLEKMFSPRKVRLRIEATFFTGRDQEKVWSGRKDDPEVRIELNVEPLKWYELKSCGNE